MKYPMLKKTENPLFEYIVRFNDYRFAHTVLRKCR